MQLVNNHIVLPIDLVRRIIVEELAIDDSRVFIYDQKFKIPTYDHMFIVIKYSMARIISSRNTFDDVNLQEVQDLNTREEITVQILSRNLEALQRKDEVVMALYSVYSELLQEANSFRIFRDAPITDLSYLEGAAQLFRFDINVVLHAWYEKIKTVEYYKLFPVSVIASEGKTESDIEASFNQPTNEEDI